MSPHAHVFSEAGAGPPRNHVSLRIIAQDPSVKGDDGRLLDAWADVPWQRMEPGPRTSRFHVVDFDASTGRLVEHPMLPDDAFANADDATLVKNFEFHAQHTYAVAARTLATFETALGRRLPWGFDGHQIFVVPHAFAEANAYYSADDRALLFGYVPGGDDGTVYTCLSHDVVAHETAHAVLDGLRHRFLEPGLPDQAAFHEGFADIVALLSLFSLHPVVEQCLGAADQDGRIDVGRVEREELRKGALTGVAEQLGKVLTQGRGALRQSALEPPPANWADDPTFLHPHRRGEVLVAIVLDVLIDLWIIRLNPLLRPDRGRPPRTLDRQRAAEEGSSAAQHLLTMMIRGLDYLPPVEFEFADLLDAVVLADSEVSPDDDLHYRDMLQHRFNESGIVPEPHTVTNLLTDAFEPQYAGINYASLRTDRDEVFRFLWQNAAEFGIDTSIFLNVESVWPSQRVGPDGLIVVESVANYIQMLDLTAAEFVERSRQALPESIEPATHLQILGGGTLVFDQFGRAKLHVSKPIDDWQRQVRRLVHLERTGALDSRGRLGFSDGTSAGQAFAQLHDSSIMSGEIW